MGAWGYSVFENDTASDWRNRADLDDYEGVFSEVKKVFQQRSSILPDATESEVALAALEIIRTEHLDEMTEFELKVCREVFERIITDSELKFLWLESDALTDWLRSLSQIASWLDVPISD